jgi:hypothetical protein
MVSVFMDMSVRASGEKAMIRRYVACILHDVTLLATLGIELPIIQAPLARALPAAKIIAALAAEPR